MNEADRTDLLPSEAARFDEVCRLGHDQLASIASTVALAFADDPIWRWLFTGGQSAMSDEQMSAFARYLVSGMVAPREIHGFRHHRVVALWHPPGWTEPEAFAAEQQRDFAANVAPLVHDTAVLGDLSAAMRSHRPDEPHWYLSTIGTHPDHQGKGLGARVLGAMHARCDQLGLPIYLESSNPANYAFYRRHGYIEAQEFSAAGSPKLLGFSRTPR